MRRRQSFLDAAVGVELMLPVTPEEYAWEDGISVETVTIDGLGDLHLAGYPTLDTRPVECCFPAHDYPFNERGTVTDPYYYVNQFVAWSHKRTVLRYLVSGTGLNKAVLIESIKYYEQDGTNDVYAKITLREYRSPVVLTEIKDEVVALSSRDSSTAATTAKSYSVVKGDTLSALCRKFYGNASQYPKVAKYNSIANANLIYVGQVITFPEVSSL